MKCSVLFEPFRIKHIRLKNRIVCPPMVTNRNIVGADGIGWYQRIARGGAGLVIVEATAIGRFGHELTPGVLRKLVEAVKGAGSRIAIQLFPIRFGEKATPRMISKQKIRDIVKLYAEAAAVCCEAGFDGVEPHGAHGYLLNQFFSAHYNRRGDEYGGSLENRMRLGCEIVESIKQAAGDKTVLFYRHTPKEDKGYGIDESLVLARKLVCTGVDVMDISPASDRAPADMASFFKAGLNVPVIANNRMDLPERAVEAIEQKRCDLVAIGRGLIADPELPEKFRTGRFAGITRCTGCNEKCYGNLKKGTAVTCVQHEDA